MSRAGSQIAIGRDALEAILDVPQTAQAIVVFAHGAGSSRLSPRNASVAAHLRSTGEFGTLLFDLLTPEEDRTYANRFEIGVLTERLVAATRWLRAQDCCSALPVAFFGASTGAAAALRAATRLPEVVRAVVSRGGRADLAGDALSDVSVPVLLIVGGSDEVVIELNEQARRRIPGPTELVIVPGATHLFEEPGALEEVQRIALRFLREQFTATA